MRPPDLIIGTRSEPQTHRWHLWLPRFLKERGWQLALHRWFRSDDDRALHDHKADSWSLILWGGYYEVTSHLWERQTRCHWYRTGSFIYRKAEAPHRVLLDDFHGAVWTLWLRAPVRRDWGFHCPKGWRIWPEYVAQRDYSTPGSESTVGRGCND